MAVKNKTKKGTLNIGHILEKIRKERGISKQKDFAKILDIPPTSYSKIVNGERNITKILDLENICEILEIPIYVFLFRCVHECDDVEKNDYTKKMVSMMEEISKLIYEK